MWIDVLENFLFNFYLYKLWLITTFYVVYLSKAHVQDVAYFLFSNFVVTSLQCHYKWYNVLLSQFSSESKLLSTIMEILFWSDNIVWCEIYTQWNKKIKKLFCLLELSDFVIYNIFKSLKFLVYREFANIMAAECAHSVYQPTILLGFLIFQLEMQLEVERAVQVVLVQ